MGGDEAEFTSLYTATRTRLAAQVYALCGSRDEASEVVQEAFVRAWAHWSGVRGYGDREAWVRKVAFRLAISRWRRLRRVVSWSAAGAAGPAEPAVAAAGLMAAGAAPDGADSGRSGQRVDLVRALAGLPERQRRAIVLHHLGGLDVGEVAEEMGVPVRTVKSWLSRGRSRLAAALGENDAGHLTSVTEEVP